MASRSIAQSVRNQQQDLLQRGTLAGSNRHDQIRQRHIWSTYCFSGATGGAVSGSGATGAATLAAGEYPIFTTPIGQNGQGYPSGLVLNLRDTNFPGINRVSDDQNFALWELGVSVLPLRQDVITGNTGVMCQGDPCADDVDSILSNGLLQIVYLTNAVTLGMLADFAQAGGPSMVAPTLVDYSQNGPAAGTGGGMQEGASATPWDQRQARIARNGGSIAPAPALRRRFDVPIFLAAGQTFNFKFTFPRNTTLRGVGQGGTGGFHLRLDGWAVESFREQG